MWTEPYHIVSRFIKVLDASLANYKPIGTNQLIQQIYCEHPIWEHVKS